MAEDGSRVERDEDVWEEEIDLRELGKNLLAKWPVWVFLPLLVMIGTGVFMYGQPDRYRVTGSFIVDVSSKTALEVDLQSLESSALEDILGSRTGEAVSVSRKQRERQRSQDEGYSDRLVYDVEITTPRPDEVTAWLRKNRETISGEWQKRIRREVKPLGAMYERRIERLNESIRAWKELSAVDGARGMGPFAERFLDYRTKLTFVNKITDDPENLIVGLDEKLDSELVGPDRTRNTVMSGVVSFLLVLFGLVFWEII
jgi:hypothetical protein